MNVFFLEWKEIQMTDRLNDQLYNNIQPGQWYQIPGSKDIPLVTNEEAAEIRSLEGGQNFWGTTGSKSVFSAWNSAAFDPVSNEMYFFGGGHADYGGNEVYQYDFDTLQWVRLTDPSPLTKETTVDIGNGVEGIGHIPESGPPAPHVYDGLTWNPVTETVWMTSSATAYEWKGMNWSGSFKGAWEFNPDTGEWTQHFGGEFGGGKTTLIGDGSSGEFLQLGSGKAAILHTDGTTSDLDILGNFNTYWVGSTGNLFTDHTTGKIYFPYKEGVFELELIPDDEGGYSAVQFTKIDGAPQGLYPYGFAYRPVDGKFYAWNGGDKITVFDPSENSFETIKSLGIAPSSSDSANNKIYEKWVYLEEIDSFAGIASHHTGMWIYTPEDSDGGNPDRPDAIADQYGILVGQAQVLDILANDTDPNGDVLTVTNLNDGHYGTVSQNEDSTVTYTPQAGFEGNDSFSYTVDDGNGGLDTTTVSVTVSETGAIPGNLGPLALQTHVADLEIDGTTTQTISLSLPTRPGDLNENGAVDVFYRKVGDSDWQQGLSFFQSNNSNNEAYSGMLHGLEEGTNYEIRVVATDDDGVQGRVEQTTFVSTKMPPLYVTEATANNIVTITSFNELQAAVDAAQAGDLIQLTPGLYEGSLIVRTSGEEGLPITIRGAEGFTSSLDAGGGRGILLENADYVHLEGLHIHNAATGIQIRDWSNDNDGTVGNVIRGNYISDVTVGINASGDRGHGNDDLFISDNILEGTNEFGDTSNATWDDEGIVVNGVGVEVQYNTLSGFGDALGMTKYGDENRAVDIHHNLVKFGGDDGVELDFGDRNVSAHHNLITNTANGVSFQYVDDGPAYAFNNIIYNVLNTFKVKPESDNNDGVFIYHNTSINGGRAWTNFSGSPDGITVVNNLFTGDGLDSDVVRADTTQFNNATLNYNAWTYDGRFQLGGENGGSYASFAEWQADPNNDHSKDVLLAGETVFSELPLDFDVRDFLTYRDPEGVNFALHPTSSANDAGLIIQGLNDHVADGLPDIGAVETGAVDEEYGARGTITVPEKPYAIPDKEFTEEGTEITVDVLANDFDPNGDDLSLTAVGEAQNGAVNLNKDGTVTYIPNEDFVGNDSFSYTVVDTDGNASQGTVSVTVTPPNSAPTAVNDVAETLENEAVQVLVTANDSDPDGDPLTIESVSDAQNGTVSFSVGTITYQPDAGFFGEETLEYTITDGRGKEATASLTISVFSDGTVMGTEHRDNIDLSDQLEGQAIFGRGGHDIITGTQGDDTIDGGNGQDTSLGEDGNDLFLFKGKDNHFDNRIDGGAGIDTIAGSDDDDIVGTWGGRIENIETIDLGAGHDVILGYHGRDLLDFRGVEITGVEMIDLAGGHDRIFGSENNDHIRGGAGDNNIDGGGGTDVAHYDGLYADHDIRDGNNTELQVQHLGGLDHLKNVEVLQFADGFYKDGKFTGGTWGQNNAPIAMNDKATVTAGETVSIDVLSNDSDPDGDALSITRISEPQNGDVVVGTDGSIHFTADPDFSGDTMFSYTISDGNGGESIAQVTVTIDAAQSEFHGTDGHDQITGTDGDDVFYSSKGQDRFSAGAGNDVFHFADTEFHASSFNYYDILIDGGAGSDTIKGSAGDNIIGLWGGGIENIEVIDLGAGDDMILGHDGRDVIDLSGVELKGVDLINGGRGHDIITGSDGADRILGGSGQDKIQGGAGDDIFLIEGEADGGFNDHDTLIDGGEGYDIILGDDADNTLGTWGDIFLNIEAIDLGNGHDVILGHYGRDIIDLSTIDVRGVEAIDGAGGHDIIIGSNTDDVILGGSGENKLTGSAGADTFIFKAETSYDARDQVTDFSVSEGDKVDISDLLNALSFNADTDALDEFVQLSPQNGGSSLLRVAQSDGSMATIVELHSDMELDLSGLIENGNLLI